MDQREGRRGLSNVITVQGILSNWPKAMYKSFKSFADDSTICRTQEHITVPTASLRMACLSSCHISLSRR